MTQRDDGPAWGRQFGADATLDEVNACIDKWVSFALSDLASQLAADPDFTNRERAAIVARAEPLVRVQTHKAFMQAWERLREEAQLDADATTVH